MYYSSLMPYSRTSDHDMTFMSVCPEFFARDTCSTPRFNLMISSTRLTNLGFSIFYQNHVSPTTLLWTCGWSSYAASGIPEYKRRFCGRPIECQAFPPQWDYSKTLHPCRICCPQPRLPSLLHPGNSQSHPHLLCQRTYPIPLWLQSVTKHSWPPA